MSGIRAMVSSKLPLVDFSQNSWLDVILDYTIFGDLKQDWRERNGTQTFVDVFDQLC